MSSAPKPLKVLFIGDVVGSPGRKIVSQVLPRLIPRWGLGLVVCNAENAAGGSGLTIKCHEDLVEAGVDVFTLGDHVYRKDEVFTLFEQRVKELAPAGVEVTVHKIHGGEAVIVPVDAAPMQAAASALKETYGREPIFMREGGSIPIAALFYNLLGVPVVMMGFGLPDDNLHAPNEKYSLSQFYKGIRTVARFLQNLSH